MPRNPPKLRIAYDTLPVVLSIISRSMWPIRSPFGLRTAVPSTRSLAISGCGFAMTSVIIPPSRVDEADQRYSPERVPSGGQGSGGQGSGFRLGIVVKGDCLEAIVARPAAPQIGDAAGT